MSELTIKDKLLCVLCRVDSEQVLKVEKRLDGVYFILKSSVEPINIEGTLKI